MLEQPSPNRSAIHNHESARRNLPSCGAGWDTAGNPIYDTKSMLASILPDMEEATTFNAFNPGVVYNDPTNRPPAKTAIPSYLCPSNPVRSSGGVDGFGYGYTDYMPIAATKVHETTTVAALVKVVGAPRSQDLGPMRYPAASIAVILDGRSQTVGVIESTGRGELFPPSLYLAADANAVFPTGSTARNSWRWAEPASAVVIAGPPAAAYKGQLPNNNAQPLGGPPARYWTVHDCGPNDEPFSFHSTGVNVLFMGGHVTFINDEVDPISFRRLLTATEDLNAQYAAY